VTETCIQVLYGGGMPDPTPPPGILKAKYSEFIKTEEK